jgi:hypothetical protein
MRIDGNETVHQLEKQGSSLPLIGPHPALGMSAKVAKGVIRGWMRRKHEDCFFNDPLLKGLGNYSN